MFWYIIANPEAGSGAVKQIWPNIERQLQALGFSYTVQFTGYKGHAIELAEKAVLKGHRHLLGIGGDGTFHELVNGVFRQTEVPTQSVCCTLLPVGTGNDWARQYGISKKINERLAALAQPRAVLQDVGKVTYLTPDGQPAVRFFNNVAGMAYDAFVAKRMDEAGKPPSTLAYLWAVARYLMAYSVDKAHLQWDETHVVEDEFYTINVGICKYSGGGMQLVPHAIPDDGMLALTFARNMPKWEVLLQTGRFYNGTILSHPKLTGHTVKTVEVRAVAGQPPLLLEADGEFLGTAPARFEVLERALLVGV